LAPHIRSESAVTGKEVGMRMNNEMIATGAVDGSIRLADAAADSFLSRRTDSDVVDLAFNRETERAQLRQPRVAVFIVQIREDADDSGVEVAGNHWPTPLMPLIDHITRTVDRSVHVLFMEKTGCGDANLNLPGHSESIRSRRSHTCDLRSCLFRRVGIAR
jgi:hypothetical protein